MTARHVAALAVVVALFAYVGVVLPPRTERLLAELRARIAEDPLARYDFYLRYLNVALVVVLVFAGTLVLAGEGAAAGGVTWPPYATRRLLPGLVAALLVLNVTLGLAWLFGRRRDPAAFEKEVQYARVEFLIPRSRRERDLWPVFCVAVGVLEEAVYRGLFVLLAAHLLGISPWWLLVPAAVVFGVGHQYQGWLGVVATTGTGAGLGILAILTGSLWPAVVVHALFDLRLMFVKPPAPA